MLGAFPLDPATGAIKTAAATVGGVSLVLGLPIATASGALAISANPTTANIALRNGLPIDLSNGGLAVTASATNLRTVSGCPIDVASGCVAMKSGTGSVVGGVPLTADGYLLCDGGGLAAFLLNGAPIADLSSPLSLAAGANTITGSGTGTLSGVISNSLLASIPALTSASGTAATGGIVTVSASSFYSAGYEAWRASDGIGTTDFVTNLGGNSWWIQAQYATPVIPVSITLKGRTVQPVNYPNAGVVEGSNDNGVSWTTLVAAVPPLPASSGEQTFAISTVTAYSQIRYRSTQKNPGALNDNIGLALFQIATAVASSLTYSADAGSTLIVSGANTYTGGTTITSGTIRAATTTALSTGSVAVNGGTLDLSDLSYAQRDTILVTATNGGGNIAPLQVEYLVVGGGGGGGWRDAGGGGAGGVLTGTATFSAGTYALAVGEGGAGSTTGSNTGTNGGNSVLDGITAYGGGGGGSSIAGGNGASSGADGASGGGLSLKTTAEGYRVGAAIYGAQGNNGGYPYVNAGGAIAAPYSAGGGGGAGGVGGNGTTNPGGAGGIGVSSSITGAAVSYGGGGAGGTHSGNTAGQGGSGGGGNGGISSLTKPTAGVDNTGGGGGGGGNDGNSVVTPGAKGGSGIGVIAYRAAYGTGKATMSGVTSDTPATRAGWIVKRAIGGAGNLVVV